MRRSPSRRSAPSARRPAAIETLESRQLLSASGSSVDGVTVMMPWVIAAEEASNAVPAGLPVAIRATTGTKFTGVIARIDGYFEHPSTLSALINWGDGTTGTIGKVVQDDYGQLVVTGEHSYTSAGLKPITVDIGRKVDGSSLNSVTLVPKVTSGALVSPSVGGWTLAAQAKRPYDGVIGTFTSSNHTLTFAASVDWGDGQQSATAEVRRVGTTNTYEVLGKHTYAQAATRSIKINVTSRTANQPATQPSTQVTNITSTMYVFA